MADAEALPSDEAHAKETQRATLATTCGAHFVHEIEAAIARLKAQKKTN